MVSQTAHSYDFAGEATVHLLERLLAFDPERRCSAEEALAHEYFAHLDRSVVHDASALPLNMVMQILYHFGVPILLVLCRDDMHDLRDR